MIKDIVLWIDEKMLENELPAVTVVDSWWGDSVEVVVACSVVASDRVELAAGKLVDCSGAVDASDVTAADGLNGMVADVVSADWLLTTVPSVIVGAAEELEVADVSAVCPSVVDVSVVS